MSKPIEEELKEKVLQMYSKGLTKYRISVYLSMPYSSVKKIVTECGAAPVKFTRNCIKCGTEFTTGFSKKQYCTRACRLSAPKKEIICTCGKPVPEGRRKYCSEECYIKNNISMSRERKLREQNRIQIEIPSGKNHSISEICRLAKESGMSYGEYIGRFQ